MFMVLLADGLLRGSERKRKAHDGTKDRNQDDKDGTRCQPAPTLFRIASAIMERAELPVQRNNTLNGWSMAYVLQDQRWY